MKFDLARRSLAGIAFIALLALSGCEATRLPIRSDYDRSVDFAAIRTYGFPAEVGTDRGGYSTLVTSHFKEAIKREMNIRGYTFTEADPDVLVNFYSETRDKTQVYAAPSGYFGFRYSRPRYGWYSAWPFYYDDIDVVTYKSGTFKLDLVDPKRKQTIWEASVEDRLSEQSQDNPQPTIARLVTEMFRKFPRGAAVSGAPK